MPNAIDQAPRRYRQVAARVCCAAACPRGRLARPYQGRRFATRWRRNLLATPSNARRRVRYPAQPPIEGYWSAEHIRRWRGSFGLVRRLGRRSPGDANQAPILLVPVNRPTRSRLAKLPLNAFQNIARCARSEFVDTGADVSAHAIHRFRHIVRRVARQVFLHRIAKKLAAGTFGAPGQPFRPFEHVVWDRYRSFHTKSITTFGDDFKRKNIRDVINTLIVMRSDWRFLN